MTIKSKEYEVFFDDNSDLPIENNVQGPTAIVLGYLDLLRKYTSDSAEVKQIRKAMSEDPAFLAQRESVFALCEGQNKWFYAAIRAECNRAKVREEMVEQQRLQKEVPNWGRF